MRQEDEIQHCPGDADGVYSWREAMDLAALDARAKRKRAEKQQANVAGSSHPIRRLWKTVNGAVDGLFLNTRSGR